MGERSVIVTGASKGIGRATALKFAESKYQVILVDSRDEAGKKLQDEITEAGGQATYLHADITRKLDVHNVIAEALDNFDCIDVLAHCDAFFQAVPFRETDEDMFDEMVSKNLRATYLLNHAVVKQFMKQAAKDDFHERMKQAAIVNLTSVESNTAHAEHALFAAAQGGVAQLTKAVAMTLSPIGARANGVGVSSIKTELEQLEVQESTSCNNAPLAREGEPEEAAAAFHFLGSPDASYITGQILYVDGGRLASYRRQTDGKLRR